MGSQHSPSQIVFPLAVWAMSDEILLSLILPLTGFLGCHRLMARSWQSIHFQCLAILCWSSDENLPSLILLLMGFLGCHGSMARSWQSVHFLCLAILCCKPTKPTTRSLAVRCSSILSRQVLELCSWRGGGLMHLSSILSMFWT